MYQQQDVYWLLVGRRTFEMVYLVEVDDVTGRTIVETDAVEAVILSGVAVDGKDDGLATLLDDLEVAAMVD